MLVVEYKGEVYASNDDTAEKPAVGSCGRNPAKGVACLLWWLSRMVKAGMSGGRFKI